LTSSVFSLVGILIADVFDPLSIEFEMSTPSLLMREKKKEIQVFSEHFCSLARGCDTFLRRHCKSLNTDVWHALKI